MQVEHLFAHQTGDTFTGHRGNVFAKVIDITTNKQLTLLVRMAPNADCQLTIRDRNNNVEAELWRTLTILWLNVAVSDPATPDEPGLDVQQFLEQAVHDQQPDVLLISSTGHAFNGGQIPRIMNTINHTVAYQTAVGMDRGVFCASVTAEGNLRQDMQAGQNIQFGIKLHYNWF